MFEKLNVTDSFKKSIESAIRTSRLSHALIFEGRDEDTRIAAAKETAKAILCKNGNKPCGCCPSCIKVDSESHPDLHITAKEGDGKMIKVDAIRLIRSQALVYPNDGDKSVFIIHDAQLMNPQSQNALLKIFEEPAHHVSFILTCPSKAALLETIISRATSYSLGEEEKKNETDEDKIQAQEKAKELIRCLLSENELSFLRKTAVFSKDRVLFKNTLEAMVPIVRDALIMQSGGRVLISSCSEEAALIKNQITQKKTLSLITALQELITDIEKAANHNLSITRFSALLYSIKLS